MLNSITIDRYLHAILALQGQYLIVRAVDVAAWLECTKASVSVAVKQMVQEGLISIGRHYALLLTEEGKRRADAFESRYDFFHRLLTEAGVNEDVAKKEAGALACSLSNPSLSAIKKRFPVHQTMQPGSEPMNKYHIEKNTVQETLTACAPAD